MGSGPGHHGSQLSDWQVLEIPRLGKFKSLSVHICGIIIASWWFHLSVIFKP